VPQGICQRACGEQPENNTFGSKIESRAARLMRALRSGVSLNRVNTYSFECSQRATTRLIVHAVSIVQLAQQLSKRCVRLTAMPSKQEGGVALISHSVAANAPPSLILIFGESRPICAEKSSPNQRGKFGNDTFSSCCTIGPACFSRREIFWSGCGCCRESPGANHLRSGTTRVFEHIQDYLQYTV
jgi:hypothetical protein